MSEIPEYIHVETAFDTVSLDVSVSEAHGVLCGLISASDWLSLDQWVSNILKESTTPDSPIFNEIVERVFNHAQVAFASGGIDLYPLLPDDDDAIEDKLQALAEFCHGFMVGLAMKDTPLDADELPEDITEILADFAAISQVETDVDDTEDSEKDYVELVEFVRVSMFIIYEYIQHVNKNDTVH